MRILVRGTLAALVGGVALAAPAASQAPSSAPPLNLSADNVSGTRGPEGDVVLLNGNVHITRGRTVIRSLTGRYLRAQGMLYLDGRVRLVDSVTTIACEHATYSEDRDILELIGNVVITDRDAVLRAPSGTYDRGLGRADLHGGVTASDSGQKVTCEHLTYFRNERRLHARGRVVGEDLENRMTLAADSVDYDRSGHEAVARGDAERFREDLRTKAAAEAANITRNGERQIQQETARAIGQLRQEAIDLSVAIASMSVTATALVRRVTIVEGEHGHEGPRPRVGLEGVTRLGPFQDLHPAISSPRSSQRDPL